MDTKLTVRVPSHLLENAKRYAQAHQTPLTELISVYLRQIPTETDMLDYQPAPMKVIQPAELLTILK